jgi:hypothetical protein
LFGDDPAVRMMVIAEPRGSEDLYVGATTTAQFDHLDPLLDERWPDPHISVRSNNSVQDKVL